MRAQPLPDFVTADADLAGRTTLALPGRAAYLAEISSSRQLRQLAGSLPPRRFVLGGGSNVVLSGDFDGLLLHMAIAGRELVGEDAEAWYVRAGAGENWHRLVLWTLANGWPGLENLALIPGTVGAAPIQNIGAYGLEIADRFLSLEAFDMDRGTSLQLAHAACRFAYRDSVFKQQGWHLDARRVVTSVTFRLPKEWQALTAYADLAAELDRRQLSRPDARQVADAVIAVRRRKLPDPAMLPNAGSFFQNPVVSAEVGERLRRSCPDLPCYAQPDGRLKIAAGWLIEQSGWKGRNLGRVGMYERQALVLVNRGSALGTEVMALARAVQDAVRQRFAVELTPEPVIL
ncbi:MAG TPA: UDP-N-acetylmuramate dehydrogenase [Candidatus Accumulibacter phosphatis]|nr:MAG: UDP-N-acetylenolpyruvoylglucosamine reductase [Candidatus Accumulibacter sp. SK-11]HAY26188.1 UDP-N-acetylenolpyruvoylglucosamine reductase [Accumulibacter sp.]HRL74427.1 UDP-N-acetylmuramate dehydrogenase [Candidatus Accumulibacter phosphatis]HCN67449.1 UDP-N-acetylenolpyruvoylglucosamine reductase [Accumulibacter sp.]HCV12282.1 UDP-N-acetylenolpyruvoylglucosamine reductase [Accumulibacter sp.]